MHPAASVIAFTVASGAGYGLLFVLGVIYARAPLPLSREYALVPLAAALILIATGLAASVAHLGRPARAWRAFSQWRSSWLSREGIAALASFIPALYLGAAVWRAEFAADTRLAGAACALLALLTVYCTARIYTSLPPIPAWRQPLVLPGYLAIGLLTGALALWWLLTLAVWTLPPPLALALAGLALTTAAIKLGYWRAIDRALAVPSTAQAVGLEALGRVRTFEAPHTEVNYLMREMGFVLARRHARRLRALAIVLLGALPAAATLVALLARRHEPALALGATLAAGLGALVERWLFFAEARHHVASYYRP
jgi:DMSO reductase anchor subunit